MDRVSEVLFGLFMALTFTGAVSVASAGREEIHTMLTTAVGCNLAWGLVDAVMYLVRTITLRGRLVALVASVRAAVDAKAGRVLIERSLSRELARFVGAVEIDSIHARILDSSIEPARPVLHREDLFAAFCIFLLVVAATFPVVLPFVFIADVGTAKLVSRGVALAMLFVGGLALGRFAGYGSGKAGFSMMAVGTALVLAITALGG